MRFSPMRMARSFSFAPLAFAGALILTGADVRAQLTPGPGGSIVGQPPGQGGQGQGGSIIGQPPGQSGATATQPVPGQSGSTPPGPGSTGGSDPVRDKLDRTNREAADIDRDGRISPNEASRIPPGTPLPR